MNKEKSTEDKILLAAKSVFIKKGLGGARMQEIADEAGINKALLHYYFRSKEKLFDKVFLDAFREIAVGLIGALESDLPLREKLKVLIFTYVDSLKKNPYLPGFVLFEMNQNPEKLEKIVSAEISGKVPKLLSSIEHEVSEGNIKPISPVHLLLNIIGMIVFPFAAKPFLSIILKKNADVDIDNLLKERAEAVYEFVINSIFYENN